MNKWTYPQYKCNTDKFESSLREILVTDEPKNANELMILQATLCSIIRGKLFRFGLKKSITEYKKKNEVTK